MAKWIVAEKAKTGLPHAVVCPNVTGRIKERVAQSKRARAGLLAILTSHKWRGLVSSGRLVYMCHVVFVWGYVCFVFVFTQAAALRSMVLRYACVPTATRCYLSTAAVCVLFCCFFGDAAFSEYFCTITVFSLYGVCVCVFLPFILDVKFVAYTSRGHTGGRSHRISNPSSFCGACLCFFREKDSAVPFLVDREAEFCVLMI